MKTENTAFRLQRIMEEKNLRQVDVLNLCKPYCQKYGVKLHKSDLSQYLSGKFQPKQDKLTILALGLNVTESWLMGYDVDQDRKLRMPEEVAEQFHVSRIENQIIHDFRSLNKEGQEKAASYISDLTYMDKYKKHGIDEVVEGA